MLLAGTSCGAKDNGNDLDEDRRQTTEVQGRSPSLALEGRRDPLCELRYGVGSMGRT